jgi:glycosyltransferase involved in cell wall biosynthesis
VITISLCMIVKNEEHAIGRCLDSVGDLADEINIVDTGSTDRTKEMAARYTDRIYDFAWMEDFSAARNFSFDQAGKEYIMWLDADDILLEKDRAALRRLKDSLSPDYDAVLMDYVLDRDVLGNAQNVTRRHRLLRRAKNFRWIQPIHEYIPVTGRVLKIGIEISHSPFMEKKDRTRNIRMLQNAVRQEGGAPSRRYQYYLANEMLGVGRMKEAEEMFRSFVDGEVENFEDHIAACGFLSHIYRVAGDKIKELESLLKTFQFAKPRADYCCRIGSWFQEQGRYSPAVYWYELALELKEPDSYNGIINKPCWTWVPQVQLAICYGKLGQLPAACIHNEKALEYFPQDPTLLDNQRRLTEAMREQTSPFSAAGDPAVGSGAHEPS